MLYGRHPFQFHHIIPIRSRYIYIVLEYYLLIVKRFELHLIQFFTRTTSTADYYSIGRRHSSLQYHIGFIYLEVISLDIGLIVRIVFFLIDARR